jgi:hypothetical protein
LRRSAGHLFRSCRGRRAHLTIFGNRAGSALLQYFNFQVDTLGARLLNRLKEAGLSNLEIFRRRLALASASRWRIAE